MNSLARKLMTIPLLAGLVTLGACSDGGSGVDNGNLDGATTMSLYLTDAPGDVHKAWIEITSVTLIGGGPPQTLLDESTGLIEITELVDQAQQLVDDQEIEPGNYAQIRFELPSAVLETDDGKVYAYGGAEHPDGLEVTGNLLCPGCAQSGLKVILAGGAVDVEEGEEAGLLLDFDVSQSFGKQAGQSGMWVMSPVIHGTKADDDELEGGEDSRREIVGEVVLADGVQIPACPAGEERSLEDFVPLATATTLTDDDGNALVFSGEASEDGTFEIKIGPPDTYELGFMSTIELDEGGPLTFEAEASPASVEVAEEDEEITGVTYTITAASCEGEDNGEEEEAAAALMSVYLTDAPGDVSRVWIDISEITLIGGGPPQTVLDEPTGLIEVTELVDQTMQLVEDQEIDAGSIAQVRVKLSSGILETDGGDVYGFGDAEHPEGAEITGDLNCPGCAQSGLKFNVAGGGEVEEGEDAGLLLDFDVSQSFGKAAGNSGRWVMRPVIHVNKGSDEEMEDGDGGRTTLTGEVELAEGVEIPACPEGQERTIEDFVPTATAATLTDDEGNPLVISGVTRPSGVFHLWVPEADSYQMGFLESLELEDGTLVFSAEVDPAEATVAEGDEEIDGFVYTITEVTCESDGES